MPEEFKEHFSHISISFPKDRGESLNPLTIASLDGFILSPVPEAGEILAILYFKTQGKGENGIIMGNYFGRGFILFI